MTLWGNCSHAVGTIITSWIWTMTCEFTWTTGWTRDTTLKLYTGREDCAYGGSLDSSVSSKVLWSAMSSVIICWGSSIKGSDLKRMNKMRKKAGYKSYIKHNFWIISELRGMKLLIFNFWQLVSGQNCKRIQKQTTKKPTIIRISGCLVSSSVILRYFVVLHPYMSFLLRLLIQSFWH